MDRHNNGLVTLGAVLALSWAVALPAQAGSLSFSATTGSSVCPTVTAPSGGTTLTRCITGTDAQLARVVAAYRALLSLDPASTNTQVLNALALSVFNVIKSSVQQREREEAVKNAEAGVAPVDMQ